MHWEQMGLVRSMWIILSEAYPVEAIGFVDEVWLKFSNKYSTSPSILLLYVSISKEKENTVLK